MTNKPIRVLIVDDSALYRKIVRLALESLEGVVVVGTAADGLTAASAVQRLNPDFVTLDLEMPVLDGLETLKRIRETTPSTRCIMISAFTSKGAEITTKALQIGAYDFVLKPQYQSVEENVRTLTQDLASKICGSDANQNDAYRGETILTTPTATAKTSTPENARPLRQPDQTLRSTTNFPRLAAIEEPTVRPSISSDIISAGTPSNISSTAAAKRIDVVCIGVSTGGPAALADLISALPSNLSVPVLIVQHMPPMFTASLAEHLSRISRIPVWEARDRQPIMPGNVYIAPGGKQMKVSAEGAFRYISITNDAAEQACKPSVNFLFRSVADTYAGNTLALILTGMGNDGLEGCKALKAKGAFIAAQEAKSCVVYGMPRQIIDNSLANEVGTISHLASLIQSSTAKRIPQCM